MGVGGVRLNLLSKVGPPTPHFADFNIGEGGIVVSKSVTTTKDEDSIGLDREEGNGSDGCDSLRSLVAKKDVSKDWLQ